jgi:hypothetical protein
MEGGLVKSKGGWKAAGRLEAAGLHPVSPRRGGAGGSSGASGHDSATLASTATNIWKAGIHRPSQV